MIIVTYNLDPDVAVIDDSNTLKAVGELKSSMVTAHQMGDDITDGARRLLFCRSS